MVKLRIHGIQRQDVGGVSFCAVTPREAVSILLQATEVSGLSRAPHVHLANAYSVALASQDAELAGVFNARDAIVFADGKSVEVAHRATARGSKSPVRQVRGPDFFRQVLDAGQAVGIRHYFLGGSPGTLARLQEQVEGKFPAARVVGAFSPPFRALSVAEIEDVDLAIKQADPDIIWVGLGTPKQDFEAARLVQSLNIPTCAVGAAFDYVAETLEEAPGWMSRWGVEWVFRLSREPRRLWKRYAVGNVQFAVAVVRHRDSSA